MAGQPELFGASSVGTVFRPAQEVAAYEALWLKERTTPRMAKLFALHAFALPSAVAHAHGLDGSIESMKHEVSGRLPFAKFGALVHGELDYPKRLRDARNPAELLYYRGDLALLQTRSVAVVGTREASNEGQSRARKLARELVAQGITVISGLAAGIDTAAHQAAIEAGGRTIAVIGTSLADTYPRENADLQDLIAQEQLLVTHVPFVFSAQRSWRENRAFYPERNVTMSALSEATVIVEAGETSGTLIQARAALKQGRKLFILNSCFERGLAWPAEMVRRGAIRVRTTDDVVANLGPPP